MFGQLSFVYWSGHIFSVIVTSGRLEVQANRVCMSDGRGTAFTLGRGRGGLVVFDSFIFSPFFCLL